MLYYEKELCHYIGATWTLSYGPITVFLTVVLVCINLLIDDFVFMAYKRGPRIWVVDIENFKQVQNCHADFCTRWPEKWPGWSQMFKIAHRSLQGWLGRANIRPVPNIS